MSGGGTAGHISPVLAVLDELKKRDPKCEVLFVGSNSPLERKVLQSAGVEFRAISAGKLRRYNRRWFEAMLDVKTNWLNARDMVRFNRGLLQARRIIREFKPDVVFVKGGYVGLPIGIMALRYNIPVVIHESDIVLGLTNRYLSKKASGVAVGWPIDVYKNYDTSKFVFTGSPLRRNAVTGTRQAGRTHFKLTEQKPIIFVIGGSQGAQAINNVIFDNLAQLLRKYSILHVTGERDIERARFILSRCEKAIQPYYRPQAFLHNDMGLGYAVADIVVSRAGANSLAELSAWSKPAIVVPLSSSANNHQAQNAQALARMGGVRILQQADLSGFKLMSEIDRLMADPASRAYLGKTLHKFYQPDASIKIAELITKHGARR